jgi:diguanylate cyclase (GGDEF)-like protein
VGWPDLVKDLRARYVSESGGRLDEASRSLERPRQDPSDRDALQGLMRRFHAFAGSASTYGFPRVSELAQPADDAARTLLREGKLPGPEDLSRWSDLLGALRALLSAQAAAVGEPSKPVDQGSRRPFDILVADDDEEATRALCRLLEEEGMSPRSVRSKAEALVALQPLPDGLITNVRLPDGSGYDLVNQLRSARAGEGPAVLMVSAQAGLLDKVEAIHCGADGYFEKPVDWQILLRRLHHLLERQRIEAGRILSVEDDPDQAAFLQSILESAGHEVRVCTDPRGFEAELVAFQPDLVLMDIVLPEISGYDLVRYLRQDERYATLPVLFLTTQGQVQARIEAARAGGDDHLVKPIQPALLLWAVASRIERARFLKRLLERDGLTNLLTHTAFLERARAAISHKDRNPQRFFAWVMIDLDHFKLINDRYGHPVGDRVLISFASLLRRRLRQSDTLGRYGGEEFAVLLEDLPQADAVRLVSRLLAEFSAQDHPAGGSSVRAAFSAGVAMLENGMGLDEWRQSADQALYAAKAEGRHRVKAAPATVAESSPLSRSR